MAITYNRAVTSRRTAISDHATQVKLEAAADAYEEAPAQLQASILAAARNGERPAAITRAIKHAYTYEYVAQLIRDDKAANPGLYAASAVAS
jgi:hypothetical protein